MKLAHVVFALALVFEAQAGDVLVHHVAGNVQVRRGVADQWNTLGTGESISSNATIKTGPGGSCVLTVDGSTVKIPAESIVDVSDIRKLTKEELMLKLAMENVRSSSYEWKNNEMNTSRTTVTHGEDKSARRTLTENNISEGRLQLNGTKVLFENAYYSTCALKTKEILRRYPQLAGEFECRYRLANALESAGLPREALNEYKAIATIEGLTTTQKEGLARKVTSLNP